MACQRCSYFDVIHILSKVGSKVKKITQASRHSQVPIAIAGKLLSQVSLLSCDLIQSDFSVVAKADVVCLLVEQFCMVNTSKVSLLNAVIGPPQLHK